jgi:hypothetical protein
MATDLTGKFRNEIRLTFDAGSELGTTTDDVLGSSNYWNWTVTNGTSTDEADLVFRDQRTLALSTSENLDLAGSLTDAYGTTITFAKVKALYVKAATANTGNIIVGGAAANTFVGAFADASDKIVIPAGGMYQVADAKTGWTVTAGTADILKIENDDGAASGTYDIIIVGTSA